MKTSPLIYRVIITEKAVKLAEAKQEIVFEVATTANKVELKKEFAKHYGEVESIRTYMTQSKENSRGRLKKKPTKRAVVRFKGKSAADILGTKKK